MFHSIPPAVLERMAHLEAIDTLDRTDGTERLRRLRQVPPETGRFLALMAACAPPGRYVEIGTSAGYSALWIALACRAVHRKLTTFEILDEKAELARATFLAADVADVVELIQGDAQAHLPEIRDVSFCFLDTEKEIYEACYEAVVSNLVPGGLLVADNAINHHAVLEPMLNRTLADSRVDATIVPIGKGLLFCRKLQPRARRPREKNVGTGSRDLLERFKFILFCIRNGGTILVHRGE